MGLGPASWRTDADIKRSVPNDLFPRPKYVFYSPRVGLGQPALKCLLSNRDRGKKRTKKGSSSSSIGEDDEEDMLAPGSLHLLHEGRLCWDPCGYG